MVGTLLLTGSTGFIGGHLLRQLEALGRAPDTVLLASTTIPGWRTMPDRRGPDGRYAFTDRNLAEAGITTLDTVLHLGAATPRTHAQAQDMARAAANVANTQYLVEHIPTPRRFVFASTLDVYGGQPCREDVVPAPATLYGAAKLYCEALLAAWSAQAGPNTSLAVLRIGHIYGPGEERYRKFIPETIRRLRAGLPPVLTSSGAERRSFLHVEDCCRAILSVAADGDETGPLNIASRNPRSILEVAQLLVGIAEAQSGSAVPAWSPGPTPGTDQIVYADRLTARMALPERDFASALAEEYDAFPDG